MVHRAAAVGFQRAADAYERGRPGYPPQIVEWLLARLGRDVLDVAAGTGKLTRELLAAGARVTAVEPVEAMRAALPASAGALDGTAEAIPLASGRVDGVVVAQAWHWFDAPRALAEIHRVLRPEGCLAVVYNRRDMDDPLQRELEGLVMPYRGEAPSYRTHAFDGAPLFAASGRTEVPWTHTADLADRVGSISFIAALEPRERERVLDRARALGPVADLAYRCEAEAWTRLSAGSTDSP